MARQRSRTPQENEAISEKVELLISEGFPEHQAIAIAFRMFRDGELSIPKETQIIYGTKRRPQNKRLLQDMKLAFELLGLSKLFK